MKEETQQAGTVVEGYITKNEVARRLKKTARTVENWQRLEIIPFVKTGHSVLFNWADVQAHLNRHFGVNRLTTKGLVPPPQCVNHSGN
jgi:excisionase family DNA binding protein